MSTDLSIRGDSDGCRDQVLLQLSPPLPGVVEVDVSEDQDSIGQFFFRLISRSRQVSVDPDVVNEVREVEHPKALLVLHSWMLCAVNTPGGERHSEVVSAELHHVEVFQGVPDTIACDYKVPIGGP